ncbi:TetR/AcrR family transcriptional regulator [Amycolatopsis aidingensis]|uniref:TetR/AcrR family transcriptional regulator n=1 Tax=Amycolatopsis aidingensis TaxID=2842453 RepID=UPI001C0BC0CE|nr:TetR/AcrR family transcriptional regulator [Amycolatopsis aidingensis]
MPRLTRAESQARTRDSLIATARELFLRDGYSATSLAKVADEAGFSTGAVYSNFQGKTALALVVLDQIHAEQLAEVRGIFLGDRPVEDKLAAFEKWANTAMSSGWPRLELEFALEARQDPELVTALANRERVAVELIAESFERQLHGLGLTGVLSAKALAGAVVSLGIGIAIQRLVDPKVSVSGIIDLLRGAWQVAGKAGHGGA